MFAESGHQIPVLHITMHIELVFSLIILNSWKDVTDSTLKLTGLELVTLQKLQIMVDEFLGVFQKFHNSSV